MGKGMKKALSGVAATAAICAVSLATAPAAFAATGTSTTAQPAQTAPLLVALGDSITFGYNLPDTSGNTVPSKSAYPIQIGQADGYRVSDLGIPGWTSTDLLQALSDPNFVRAVQSANVVSIDIGSNDLLHLSGPLIKAAQANPTAPLTITAQQQQEFQTAITAFAGNLGKIVGAVRKLTNAPILLYNLYDPFPVGTGLNTVTEQLEGFENGAIAQVAANVPGVTVVDAHKAFATHELTYVRVAENDVHPTVVGQGVLAQIGETALLPDLATISKEKTMSVGTTSLLAGGLAAKTGGSLTGTLNGSQVTLSVPSGSLNEDTEADITSQPASALSAYAASHTSVAAEVAVNVQSGVQFGAPYQLTVSNPDITKAAAVYEIQANGSLVAVPSAKVSAGQAVISGTTAGDFVVLNPQQAVVTGVTKPVTGLPFTEEGGLAGLLVAAGASFLWLARRRRSEG